MLKEPLVDHSASSGTGNPEVLELRRGDKAGLSCRHIPPRFRYENSL
jgi:hypothetical protein